MYTKRVRVAGRPSLLSMLGLGSSPSKSFDYDAYMSPPIMAPSPASASDAKYTPYGAMTAGAVMSPPFAASPPLIAITPSGSPVLSAPPAGPAVTPEMAAGSGRSAETETTEKRAMIGMLIGLAAFAGVIAYFEMSDK